MKLDNLDISPELREKAKACTSPEELMELAKREGYKLTETELESVSGGGWTSCDYTCDDSFRICPRATLGDARSGIDPEKAHSDFVNGTVDGGELD